MEEEEAAHPDVGLVGIMMGKGGGSPMKVGRGSGRQARHGDVREALWVEEFRKDTQCLTLLGPQGCPGPSPTTLPGQSVI